MTHAAIARPFQQVDVFTHDRFRGNPVAVVLDGTGLTTEQMQRFTDWTNLSEATFVLPPEHPDADYKLRIFCPGRELPFAGHPTLGSCHAWLQAAGSPRGEYVVQECGVGLVRVRRDGDRLAFAAPPLRQGGPLDEAELSQIASGLGLARGDIVAHAWCDNGPRWRAVMLRSVSQLLALRPDAARLAGMEIGVIAPSDDAECAFEVRAFFPSHHGLLEDPVTGSLNAAMAQWLMGAGLAPSRYVVSQGTTLGRAGRVYVERDAHAPETIWIGGQSITCMQGQVWL